MTLEQQDKEDLKFILQKMYPGVSDFQTKSPTLQTMEIYLRAVQGNIFCNNAMTDLVTGLATGPAGHIYRGPMKRTVRLILKRIRDSYRQTGISFYICNQVVKLKFRSPLVLSLEGNPGAIY